MCSFKTGIGGLMDDVFGDDLFLTFSTYYS